jgi:hypothetical protein
MKSIRDPCLDDLLLLDGQIMVVDPAGGYWVKFVARRVPPSLGKPHGLDYSLTLHAANGERLVGFDNAHAVGKETAFDHNHRLERVQPYEYRSAADLLADFWQLVDAVLKERGVLP